MRYHVKGAKRRAAVRHLEGMIGRKLTQAEKEQAEFYKDATGKHRITLIGKAAEALVAGLRHHPN